MILASLSVAGVMLGIMLRIRAFLYLALAAVISLGLLAPQLLPTLELTTFASRSVEGLSIEQASKGSLGLSELVNGLVSPMGLEIPPVPASQVRPNSMIAA